jgi:hypothetical protein
MVVVLDDYDNSKSGINAHHYTTTTATTTTTTSNSVAIVVNCAEEDGAQQQLPNPEEEEWTYMSGVVPSSVLELERTTDRILDDIRTMSSTTSPLSSSSSLKPNSTNRKKKKHRHLCDLCHENEVLHLSTNTNTKKAHYHSSLTKVSISSDDDDTMPISTDCSCTENDFCRTGNSSDREEECDYNDDDDDTYNNDDEDSIVGELQRLDAVTASIRLSMIDTTNVDSLLYTYTAATIAAKQHHHHQQQSSSSSASSAAAVPSSPVSSSTAKAVASHFHTSNKSNRATASWMSRRCKNMPVPNSTTRTKSDPNVQRNDTNEEAVGTATVLTMNRYSMVLPVLFIAIGWMYILQSPNGIWQSYLHLNDQGILVLR